MIHSMTAFARGEARGRSGRISLELRSVNHRYLDLSLRLPDALRRFEPLLRDALRTRLERGKLEVAVRFAPGASSEQLTVHEGHLDALLEAAGRVAERLGARAGTVDPLQVLHWPGVLDEAEVDEDALAEELSALVHRVLDDFVGHRAREGARLAAVVETRLAGIEEIVTGVRAGQGELVEALRARLRARAAELATELHPERLELEVALLAQKADVAEELDRLDAHIAEIRGTLAVHGPAGRRLDFLAQELNREANTLASKASAADVALRAVDLKVLIEQIREQIQNIE